MQYQIAACIERDVAALADLHVRNKELLEALAALPHPDTEAYLPAACQQAPHLLEFYNTGKATVDSLKAHVLVDPPGSAEQLEQYCEYELVNVRAIYTVLSCTLLTKYRDNDKEALATFLASLVRYPEVISYERSPSVGPKSRSCCLTKQSNASRLPQ